MKTLRKTISVLFCFALSVPAFAFVDRAAYREALNLYRHGMYERAYALFSREDDDLCRDYATLCAIHMGLPGLSDIVAGTEIFRPRTVLYSSIHHQYGLRLFGEGDYEGAFEELSKVDERRIRRKDMAELSFKKGYCKYASGDFEGCIPYFQAVSGSAYSEYMAPSRFILGSISYQNSDFESAQKWYSLTADDARFKDLSGFYILDCRFMAKDYAYVIEHGEDVFQRQGQERKKYLSRILSEAYLVMGNAAKAREFLEMESDDPEAETYENLFHKASVLYAVGDYRGAIDYFTRMENPVDSLGQVAMYHLGNSYIQTRNKVGALGAFRNAMTSNYNPFITEDAFFNYAKLSFEVNNDVAPLKQYKELYSASRKGDELYRYLALCALKSRNYSEAVEYYDEIDELSDPDRMNYTKASFQRSFQLLSEGSYREAAKYLRCVPHFLPKNDPIARLSRYWLADTYYRMGSWDESLKIYTDLYNTSYFDRQATSALLPYNIAFCNYRLKEYNTAAKWFDTYLSSADTLVREDALVRRADCDFERGLYRESAESYRKAASEFPDRLYAYYYQAVAYELLRDNAGCISALEPAVTKDPGAPYYVECLNALGSAYIRSGKYQDAEKTFEILKENASDNTSRVMAYMGLGVVLRNTGREEEALDSYKSVVALMPRSTYSEDALQAIKTIYGREGHPETFLAYLDSVGMSDTQSASDKDELFFNTAQQVFLSGDYSNAVRLLDMYLQNCPSGVNVPSVHFYLGESYRQLGRKEACIDEYRKSLALDSGGPFSEPAMLSVAKVCYELERFGESLEAYAMLRESAQIPANVSLAEVGAMRSAFKDRNYAKAAEYAAEVRENPSSADLHQEAKYIQARSYLNMSRRDEALELFSELADSASTPQGAEACYIILQSKYDLAQFDEVESGVYDFASKCGDQMYWLAKAYILLGDAFVARGNVAQARVTYESIRDEYAPVAGEDDIHDTVIQKLAELEK